jgi:predicted nucleotidyltransferase
MTMLDLDRVDLADLCEALEDHTDEHEWWIDPATGDVQLWSAFLSEEGEVHPEERGLVLVDPIDSGESYRDMEDFATRAGDSRAKDLLLRSLAGRGAFRRFKDTLFEFPELRAAWFRFHDARVQRRAIEWLLDHDLIAGPDAERALTERADPDLPELGGGLDPHRVAAAVAADLRTLYGDRLRTVVLFGSWARGDAHPESDIDLLVVLDEVPSRQRELRRMRDVLWRHSLANDTVVTEIPVSEREYRDSDEPLLARARLEGVRIR